MPLLIGADGCISCGVCEPACPNGGICKDPNSSVYVIDGDACTECVGFYNKEQCAAVCPMDCCVPDPRRVMTEAALFERAKALHANTGKHPVLSPQTSHFRKQAPRKWWQRLLSGSEGNEAAADKGNAAQGDVSCSPAVASD